MNKLKLKIMAKYEAHLLYAVTKNMNDLKKISHFLEENTSDCFEKRMENFIECEFNSSWDCPEKVLDNMVSLLESKENIYIRMLTRELCSDHIITRVFSCGEWE